MSSSGWGARASGPQFFGCGRDARAPKGAFSRKTSPMRTSGSISRKRKRKKTPRSDERGVIMAEGNSINRQAATALPAGLAASEASWLKKESRRSRATRISLVPSERRMRSFVKGVGCTV